MSDTLQIIAWSAALFVALMLLKAWLDRKYAAKANARELRNEMDVSAWVDDTDGSLYSVRGPTEPKARQRAARMN